jgi:hypothetical protein
MKKSLWWIFVVLTCPLWSPFAAWYLMRAIGEVASAIITDWFLEE